MKFNLKNRPQTITHHKLGDELSDFEIEVNRWFDGFKKELLEMCEGFQITPYAERVKFPTHPREVITLILGEDSS